MKAFLLGHLDVALCVPGKCSSPALGSWLQNITMVMKGFSDCQGSRCVVILSPWSLAHGLGWQREEE